MIRNTNVRDKIAGEPALPVVRVFIRWATSRVGYRLQRDRMGIEYILTYESWCHVLQSRSAIRIS